MYTLIISSFFHRLISTFADNVLEWKEFVERNLLRGVEKQRWNRKCIFSILNTYTLPSLPVRFFRETIVCTVLKKVFHAFENWVRNSLWFLEMWCVVWLFEWEVSTIVWHLKILCVSSCKQLYYLHRFPFFFFFILWIDFSVLLS